MGTSALPDGLRTASESGKALGYFQNEMLHLCETAFDFLKKLKCHLETENIDSQFWGGQAGEEAS